jgi:hypothetical protein
MDATAKLPPEKLDALMEELEAERQRRIDEKVAKGEAIRAPALSVVVGTLDEVDAAVEEMKARVLAADREAGGRAREVYFEEPAVLITGVPRDRHSSCRMPDFAPAEAKIDGDTKSTIAESTSAVATTRDEGEPANRPAWVKIWTQVTAPSEGCPGGIITEGQYAVVDGEVRVEDLQGKQVGTQVLRPGDDPRWWRDDCCARGTINTAPSTIPFGIGIRSKTAAWETQLKGPPFLSALCAPLPPESCPTRNLAGEASFFAL